MSGRLNHLYKDVQCNNPEDLSHVFIIINLNDIKFVRDIECRLLLDHVTWGMG